MAESTDSKTGARPTPSTREAAAFKIPLWGQILGVVLALLFLGVFFTGLYIPPGLTLDGTKIMGILLFSIPLYITEPVSSRQVGLYCSILLVIGNFPITTVFQYFLTDTPWMMVGVYGLTFVMRRTGLAQRLALHLLKYVSRSYLVMMAVIFVLNLCFSFMGVSSVQRAQIVAAVIAPMVIAAGAEPWSIERAGPILWTVAAAYFTDRMILTGSTVNPLFLSIMDLDWDFATWFINMGIPYMATTAILAVLLFFLMRPKLLQAPDVSAIEQQLRDLGPMGLAEKKVVVYLVTIFILVMTQPYHGLRPGFQLWLVGTLMCTPLIGVYSLREWVRAIPWDTFFIGIYTRAFSDIARTTGFAAALAAALVFPGLPQTPFVIFAYFAIIACVAKIGLISNQRTFGLILPIATAWAVSQGLPTAGYGAAVHLAIPHVGWFVYMVPTYVYMIGLNEEYQLYTDAHIVRYGLLAVVATIISLPIWFTYWSGLGLL